MEEKFYITKKQFNKIGLYAFGIATSGIVCCMLFMIQDMTTIMHPNWLNFARLVSLLSTLFCFIRVLTTSLDIQIKQELKK